MNKPITSFWMVLVVVISMLGYARDAQADFIASDFSVTVEAEQPFFQSGDVVIFDGILRNLSSQTANFGSNITSAGISLGPQIDGQNFLRFPFIESFDVEGFPDQSIAPGGSLRFPLLFIDTGPDFPLGTTITSGGEGGNNGNLLFRNIPPSTSDPFVDFFIPISNIASATAVPEPTTWLLLTTGLLGLLGQKRLAKGGCYFRLHLFFFRRSKC